jgi:hypothetical protein
MTLLFWICSSRLGEPDMLVRQVLTDYYAYESLKMTGCEIKLAGDLTFFKKLFLFPVVDFCDEVALFSKTKTDNPSSNSTWNRTQYLSIKRSQTWSVPVIYACLITALSLKTATDSSSPKIDNSSNKTPLSWHHSVDKKHSFLHVKFEVRFVISFARKSMSTSDNFHGRWSILFFQKAKFGKFGNFLVFLDWKMLGAHGACVCRVQKSKWSSQNVRLALSCTWRRVKSLLYTHKKVKPEQQRRNLGSFAQVWC